MELLAPAGSMDALRAAVQNGADAVYLGGATFNARQYAGNFTDLEAAVSYAHLREVKVYFTLNTLLLDKEFPEWATYVEKAAAAGADAFIVQDIGGAEVLKRICPDVPMHASTQMTVHNTQAARSLKEFGFSRIILSRELTAAQIARITDGADVETEVFVHGALCYCYSGQCLMSSMLGGRSANRGACAQPCRLQYTLGDSSGYLLSTKDLCLVNYIGALRQTGACALKIEGRMKRPEYIAAVTRVYRKALDEHMLEQEDYDMLALAFNRGGFTSGLFSVDERRIYKKQPDHIGLAAGKVVSISGNTLTVKKARDLYEGDELRPALPDAQPQAITHIVEKDGIQEITVPRADGFEKTPYIRQVSSARQLETLRESISGNNKKLPLFANIKIREDLPAVLEVRTQKNIITSVVSAKKAQHARTHPVTYEDIKSQLAKTGDYPFYFKRIDYSLSPQTAFPFSGLNALRREALRDISQKLLEPHRHTTLPYTPVGGEPKPWRQPQLVAQVLDQRQANAVQQYVDALYVPIQAKWADKLPDATPVVGVYPHIISDRGLREMQSLAERFDTVMMSSFLRTQQNKLGDYGLNVSNSESLAQVARMGFTRATLSLELNTAQINDIRIPPGMQTELVVYGRVTLMVSEHCPRDCDRTACLAKQETLYLKDRKGASFPVLWEGSHCRVRILNSVPIYMADKLDTIHADVMRLVFTVETPEECAAIAAKYRRALNPAEEPAELGHDAEYTRGHYNRGWGNTR